MNRRDAIRAVMAMPAVASIAVLKAEANDVIVFECEEYLAQEQRVRIAAEAQKVWPNRKIVVLDHGMKLKVMREQS